MSIDIDEVLMAEVGFHSHYQWYNGSGSCEDIRNAAARKLPDVLRAHSDIYLAPDAELMKLAERVACNEGDRFCLTKTWQVVADIIRLHLKGYMSPVSLTAEKARLIASYQPKMLHTDLGLTKNSMAWYELKEED